MAREKVEKTATQPKTEITSATMDEAVSIYKDTGSIKETALRMEMSQVKVRKILLTRGLWSSPRSIEIGKLLAEGKTVKEVAAELGISPVSVQAYMPYEKGLYGEEDKSNDAVRSEEYRERQSEFTARQNAAKKENGAVDIPALNAGIQNTPGTPGTTADIPSINVLSADESYFMLSKPYHTAMTVHSAEVYRLKFELVGSRKEDFEETEGYMMAGQTETEWKILQKYGKVKKSISREALVNSNITLRQLHFIIQMLFGWQHSHLHEFTLTDEDMDKIVDFGQDYLDLCGVYFRFPVIDFEDDFWDDDYEEGMSPKTWMRMKYRHPHGFPGISDELLENRRMVNKWVKWLNKKKKGMIHYYPTWEEREKGNREGDVPLDGCYAFQLFSEHFEKNPKALREHLKLNELLAWGKTDPETGKYNPQTTVMRIGTEFNEFGLDSDDGLRLLGQLLGYHNNPNDFDMEEYEEAAEEFRKLLYKENYENSEKWSQKEDEKLDELARKLQNLAIENQPLPLPIAKTFYYNYDFGDNWWIKITVEDVYSVEEIPEIEDEAARNEMVKQIGEKDVAFFNKNCEYIDGELYELVKLAWGLEKPVCIAKDGLDVMDDVGGVGGYINFLQELHEGDKETRAENKEWARSQGWTGRDRKPEKML